MRGTAPSELRKNGKTFHFFKLLLIDDKKLLSSNSTYLKLPPTHRTPTSGLVSLA